MRGRTVEQMEEDKKKIELIESCIPKWQVKEEVLQFFDAGWLDRLFVWVARGRWLRSEIQTTTGEVAREWINILIDEYRANGPVILDGEYLLPPGKTWAECSIDGGDSILSSLAIDEDGISRLLKSMASKLVNKLHYGKVLLPDGHEIEKTEQGIVLSKKCV